MKNSENLEEGWVHFNRIYCKKGYIDVWTGSKINDPNDFNKYRTSEEETCTYVRFDFGIEWIHEGEFKEEYFKSIIEYSENENSMYVYKKIII